MSVIKYMFVVIAIVTLAMCAAFAFGSFLFYIIGG